MEKPIHTHSLRESAKPRLFFKKGVVAGAAAVSASLLATPVPAFAQEGPEEKSGRLTPGDAAMLRFAAAAEILETDFWVPYNDCYTILPKTPTKPAATGKQDDRCFSSTIFRPRYTLCGASQPDTSPGPKDSRLLKRELSSGYRA